MFDKKSIDALKKGLTDSLKAQEDIINKNMVHLNENQQKEVQKIFTDIKSKKITVGNAQSIIADTQKKLQEISKIK